MYNAVTVRHYPSAPVERAEILRYAGVRQSTPVIEETLQDCLRRSEGQFAGAACYAVYPVQVRGETVDLGFVTVPSRNLAKALAGCDRAAVFAATAGMAVDRLIRAAELTDLAGALLLQAIGTAQIERICDTLCGELAEQFAAEGCRTRPRFSPGYGDLPLTMQTDLFTALNVTKHIGVTLTEALLMVPSKSVTAIVGIGQE